MHTENENPGGPGARRENPRDGPVKNRRIELPIPSMTGN